MKNCATNVAVRQKSDELASVSTHSETPVPASSICARAAVTEALPSIVTASIRLAEPVSNGSTSFMP